jgi:hypothetical protein
MIFEFIIIEGKNKSFYDCPKFLEIGAAHECIKKAQKLSCAFFKINSG